MPTCLRRLMLYTLPCLLAAPAAAELTVPTIFSNHMVLQREQSIPVWGWDTAGTEVTVKLGDVSKSATANDDGKWVVRLPAQQAGGPHTLSISGSSTKDYKDVLIGEVWVCSGQSNMEWPVSRALNYKEEKAAANHPQIRHIKFAHRPSAKPATDVPSPGWQICTPDTVSGFTAVGYYFGRKLNQELDVPIGLIGSNWGGTRIEPWTPPVGFIDTPKLKDIADKLDEYPTKKGNGVVHQSPLALYNGMIHPMVPYAIRGAIWYQGESNNGEGMLYHEKMKALIHGWRTIWENKDLPFYFVQLAPYKYGGDPQRLAGIWEAQLETVKKVPNTGMAVTTDITNLRDIHPKNKQDVGLRLALWALAKNYGRDGLVFSGPLYKSMAIEGNKIRLSFDHLGGGLVSRDDKPLSWFSIAGEDGKFVDAKAEIDGDTVVVSAESVAEPKHVRFGWDQLAEPNLMNKAGLPASPFRTGE